MILRYIDRALRSSIIRYRGFQRRGEGSRLRRCRRVRNAVSVAAVLLVLAGTRATVNADEILVSAAASLADALKEIATAYQARSKHKLRFNFGPSSGLARQIDEGAPADIFFSADLAQMDALDKKDRIEPGTRKNLLSNHLVIIAPADSKLVLSSPKDLLKKEVNRVALAEPSSVPAGVYARLYLSDEGVWDRVQPKIVPVQDVRATLAAVASGNVDAGFVYKTDAALSNKVKIIHEAPFDKGPKITYPIAIVKHSKRKQAAREFLIFIQGPIARSAFGKHGFVVLD